MERKNRLKYSIGLVVLFCLTLVLSFLFVKYESKAALESDLEEVAVSEFLVADELDFSDSFEDYDMDSEITDFAAGSKKVEYSNKYGTFSFNATKKGKVKKYTSSSLSTGFLIKGTASFKKCDISFSGSFYVADSGRVMFYKGDMTLPEGDSYSGTFYINGKNNSYKKGTYTWKNGHSFKGMFSVYTTDSGNKKSCYGDGEAYGAYYFGSKNHYLYAIFVKGKPNGTASYCKYGTKYKAVYDSNGKCTSIKKKS